MRIRTLRVGRKRADLAAESDTSSTHVWWVTRVNTERPAVSLSSVLARAPAPPSHPNRKHVSPRLRVPNAVDWDTPSAACEGVKSDDLGAILRGLSERLIAHGVPLCRTNLPSWAIAEPLRSGALRRVLAGREPPPSTIYVVYPGNRLMSMKVRAFVDHLARHFGRTPYWEKGL